MRTARKRHPLDEILIADIGDIHCQAGFLAKAEGTDLSGHRRRQDMAGSSGAVSAMVLSAILNRRIATIAPDAVAASSLIHGFAWHATRRFVSRDQGDAAACIVACAPR